MPLTGKQIDGIWHTSVVVFGKEIFYGQGILTTAPGQSHHGTPLHVIDMGETAIDEETFEDYLNEMREHYTADKYHLLDFNCNSFTNDCVGFLTGQSIPAWIKDLPSDFLSTPFGAALRPTIDAMFRRPAPGTPNPPVQPSPQAAAAAAAASPNPALASSLLQAVAAQAFAANGAPSASALAQSAQGVAEAASSTTTTAPVHICTNPASFHSTLKTHRAVIAFFTSQTCPPCRMIEPTFEQLAHEKTQSAVVGGGGGIAFVKVDLGAGMGNAVGAEYGVRATPTFIFFKDGNKTHQMSGANAAELKTQVDLLLWDTYPPHPHTQKSIPSLDSVSTDPILFKQVPDLNVVLTKLSSFIDAANPQIPSSTTAKAVLSSEVIPVLKARFASNVKPSPSLTTGALSKWTEVTRQLSVSLPAAQLFPLVDLWRLALLDGATGAFCASASGGSADPIQYLLVKGLALLSDAPDGATRNYFLTLLRLLSNAFATPALARTLLSGAGKRTGVTALLVHSLLHADGAVRTAAASLAFNVAACVQRARLEQVRARYGPFAAADEDGDWEVEVVSAVLEALQNETQSEALQNETQSEDIVHRLTACLAFLLRFSPVYESHVGPLLEVLQAKDTLKAKLAPGGCGEQGVKSPNVRKLITQVADNLC
ncbi:PPPDE putative peptidase domain-containing protein [Phanerochaete sordida]|uniref:PPPDE putative peptidase domain-containing protein n=1 Tax=Phanerochaete sordida TaxID=48140 RepID=A0A9P3G4U4_9APHY|nr:PPPDE putative peptidase domain-containing protein [Phanerochaete sordida]